MSRRNRRGAWPLAFATVLLLSAPATSREAPPDAGAEVAVLVPPGARFNYHAHTVGLPAERYGAMALHDLDGRSAESRPSALPAGIVAPEGWPADGLSRVDAQSGPAPLASQPGSGSCQCATVVSNSDAERLAALYATHRFPVPDGVAVGDFDMLELRVAYRDGIRAHLNGHLIAERNLSGERDETAARRARGPEWEEFRVALRPELLVSGENLLSVEVRPSKNSHGARLDAELKLRKTGRLLRGPMIQQAGKGQALIRFDTELPTTARVEYGSSGALGSVARSADGALARHHEVRLTGLKPGQAVHYRVLSGGRITEPGVFHMPPGPGEPLHFAVYGDMRGGHRVHAKIVESLLAETIDFVLVTGDLVLRGSDEADWQRFFAVARPLLSRVAFYPVVGNHDMGRSGDEQRSLSELFSLWPGPKDQPAWASWYSFELGGVHFVMLDSNSYKHEEQLAWLEADLKAAHASGARAIFATVHAGPYSRGPHRGNLYAAEHYAPLLRKYDVSLLFSGHDHLYQRGSVKGLNYIVSGGGGAPLYPIQCGVKGRKRCEVDDGMEHVERAHHYIVVSVFPGYIHACPKRVDGTPLESCTRYPLRKPQVRSLED